MKKRIIALVTILIMLFATTNFAFAAADPAVSIVNPVSYSSVASNNLLVSVKLTQPKTIKVTVSEIKKLVGNSYTSLNNSDMKAILDGSFSSTVSYASIHSESFSSSNKLSFYTKKLTDVNPGVYVIKVDTISGDKIVYSSRSYVSVTTKSGTSDIFESPSTGTASFLQNLIKTIFGN